MKASLQQLCGRFAQNRAVLKQKFKLESSYLYPVCANLFCARGVDADPQMIDECKQVLKSRTGVFSNFRSNLRMPVVCMLATGGNPDAQMDMAVRNYTLLKRHFFTSEYLALAAFLLTELGPFYEETAMRGKAIYKRMKQEHPFLTSSEDNVFAVFLACSPKSNDALIEDMESSYQLLKMRFSSSNNVQAASQVLALAEGEATDKAVRMIKLCDAIVDAGGKFGKYYELSTLAALSLLDVPLQELVEDLMDADRFLSTQPGYRFLGFDRRTRLQHAALLVSGLYARQPTQRGANGRMVQNAAFTGTLALIAAQQAAMCASIAATSAASS